ncbi:MAG: CCA tRNA nucleotidyltransferase [Candidatus Hodarchaeaceae archaeon]|nr:CCA tRNA nucleotidyltransferase [Candidatus Hodarchaeaceae archaeon]
MADILEEVLKRVRPTEADQKRIERVASELIRRTKAACAKLKANAKPMLVGSAARGTWLRTERDIDIFILFPEGLPREELERQGLAVAREVAGPKGRERFAEHPYVMMKFEGFEVDLVPCYDVAKPSEIRSAVDRTPHHQRYVKERLTPELADEVLLVKKFMDGIKVYGAELQVRGFSGYLCELLTLRHGSFQKLVGAVSQWKPGVIIDLERSYADESEPKVLFEGQPLIVIDPVDPNRNVGAAVSMQNFAVFVRACQEFIRAPSLRFFFPRRVKLLNAGGVRRILKRRGTKLFCVAFRSPDVVPDVLYPQLRKTERTLVTRLAQSGFEVLRSDVWADFRAVIVLELSVARLPRVRTRVGPPITLEAEGFIREHLGSKETLAGPFVDAAGRVVFELEREQTDARRVLEQALAERAAFGKHVAEAIGRGHEIFEGAKLAKLLRDRKFREFISEYLAPCLPWYR